MTAKLIDGKAEAAKLRNELSLQVTKFNHQYGFVPTLVVVLVGDDPASQVYVRNKVKQTKEVGMNSTEHRLPATVSQSELVSLVRELNADKNVHGILVQLPLPKGLDSDAVIREINPNKDVDGLTELNAGRLSTGAFNANHGLVACTPLGSLRLIHSIKSDISGLEAVVIGRSNLFGKPMAQLLLQQNCTVTIAHSRTHNLSDVCRRADILIAAVGRAELVKADWVKPSAIVIDVGINRILIDGKAKLIGDVDFQGVSQVANAISPVPGGVGPMTIAFLLRNTLEAAKLGLNA
jgi:methylenetetrahydrofolate dehydrogenase (NADP+) / methenyltetrahydrofolate cyclohydrolase